MRSYNLLGIVITCLCTLAITSCANNRDIFSTQVRPDLTRENWIQNVNLDPSKWTAHLDGWFYNGKPTEVEKYGNDAPYTLAMTTMQIRVPDFTSIQVDGPYRVQIVGSQEHNSVFVYGPNFAARQTAVEIRGSTLFIHPPKDAGTAYLNRVIVRIGIHNLRNVYFNGGGDIEGKNITSDALNIVGSNCGHLTLAGEMNLTTIKQTGGGNITVLGAYTPALNIRVYGKGIVNVNGRVGVRSIDNRGGHVNIIGADSDLLTVYAAGPSTTSISGYVNLKKLTALDNSRVYMYWVNSTGAYINLYDWSRVGLAGSARNLNLEVSNSARFEGQYLHVDNIYVRTRGWSHANVYPGKKLFAAALDDSSIYFFGSPNVISRYTAKNGAVIPVWGDACPVVPLSPPEHASWDTWNNAPLSYKGETIYRSPKAQYKG
jgi:hypothetical protein